MCGLEGSCRLPTLAENVYRMRRPRMGYSRTGALLNMGVRHQSVRNESENLRRADGDRPV
jgi:hypothetical protein